MTFILKTIQYKGIYYYAEFKQVNDDQNVE